MKTARLVRDYGRLSEANLDVKAQAVISALTGNANFVVTSPTLSEFTAVKDAYSTALVNAAGRERTAIALKNQAKDELLQSMRYLAINIESLSKGDRAKLTSSGFDLVSDGDSLPPLSNPAYKVEDGANPGELKSIAKRVPGALSYNHEYTIGPLTPESVWITIASSKAEVLITGLPSGERVYCRVAAVGTKDQVAYSNVLSRVVQ